METETPTKKPVLTEAADWTRQNKYWLLVLVMLLLAASFALWVLDARRSAQLSALRAEYAATAEKLKAAEAEVQESRQRLAEKTAELVALQTANDRRVKEVTADAYKKARDLPDDSLVDAYNALITDARQRNVDRERTDTGSKE